MPAVEPFRIRKTPFGNAGGLARAQTSPFDVIEDLRAADAAPRQTGYEVFSVQHAFDGLEAATPLGPRERRDRPAPRPPESLYRLTARLSWTLARLALYGLRLRLAVHIRRVLPAVAGGRAAIGALSWRRR